MDRCAECPAAGPCIAERTRHRGYCDWARAGGAWRERVAELSIEPAPAYPPLAAQAGNLLGALGRVVAAVVRGEEVKVPTSAYDARLAICRPCEFNGERPDGIRCTECGCGGIKLTLATEKCPVGKW